MLWLGALCLLVACGPGVNRELERPRDGESAPVISRLESEWVDLDLKQVRVRALGTGFRSDSTLRFRGERFPAQRVSDTELVGTVPVEGASWGVDLLQVESPSPGGGLSDGRYLPYPEPVLLGISPDTLPTAPGGPVRVRVTGRNFVAGGVLRFRGLPWPTTVLDTRTAEAELAESVLFTASPEQGDSVELTAPGPQNRVTAPLLLRVRDPEPRIEGVVPAVLSTIAGDGTSPTVEVRILGRDLRSSTVVTWNGVPVTSSPLNRDEHRVRLPRELLTPGVASVRLSTPLGLQSPPFPVSVVAGPALAALTPQWVPADVPSIVMQVSGTGFGPDSVVYLDGLPLEPQFIDGSEYDLLRFVVPPGTLTSRGAHSVTVRRGSNATASAPLFFQVVDETPAPWVNSLSPPVVPAGNAGDRVRLQVHGIGFTPRSSIQVDGQGRSTTLISWGVLETWLSGSDLTTEGMRTVTVHTPGPGGGTSLPLLLKVEARRPVPLLTGMQVSSVEAGHGDLNLVLLGAGLLTSSEVHWNGASLSPVRCCLNGTLSTTVPARLLATPGVARVKVSNPAPGGGTSEELLFVIREPRTADIQLSNSVLEFPDGDTWFQVWGRDFTVDSQVTLEGRALPTSFRDAQLLHVSLTPADLPTRGALEVRVLTPGQPPTAPAYLHVVGVRPPHVQGVSPGVVSLGQWTEGQQRGVFLSGQGFAPLDFYLSRRELAATVEWGGRAHPLRVASRPNHTFEVWLGDEDVARPGPLQMTVSRAAEGGTSSLPFLVNVVAERPVPYAFSVRPSVVRAGAPALRLRLVGEGFHAASEVRWNDLRLTPRRWEEGIEEGLEVVVPAAALAEPGLGFVTVVTPGPGGGTSLPLTVRVE